MRAPVDSSTPLLMGESEGHQTKRQQSVMGTWRKGGWVGMDRGGYERTDLCTGYHAIAVIKIHDQGHS